METKLHAVINKAGEYEGFSANYSGAGFSDMHFKFHGLSTADFDRWVQSAKTAGSPLSRSGYLQLERPSEREPVRHYASVAPGLYDAILNRCVESNKMCMKDMAAIDQGGGQGLPSAYNLASPAGPAKPGLAGIDGKPVRTYVAAMCGVNDPPDAPYLAAPRPN
jgi:cytochrome o ubiquinol oxidase subunit 2